MKKKTYDPLSDLLRRKPHIVVGFATGWLTVTLLREMSIYVRAHLFTVLVLLFVYFYYVITTKEVKKK